jgi:enoyl-CoA hydratase/carnithine racemase
MAVDFSAEGGIGYITLDKPPANSYDRAMVEEFGTAVQEAGADDAVKVVILRSASEKFFSAGADVKAFMANSPDDNLAMVATSHEALATIATIPKVFVAQIQGHALGGGLELALACDLRFAAQGDYRLGVPEVTLGLLPGNGGTQRLSRLIGASRALELMLTGRQVKPAEALELGIVNRVLAADETEAETLAFAEKLAGGATKAIGNIKLAVWEGIDRPLGEGLARERELVGELFRSQDAQEGLGAFLEKREPAWTGA